LRQRVCRFLFLSRRAHSGDQTLLNEHLWEQRIFVLFCSV